MTGHPENAFEHTRPPASVRKADDNLGAGLVVPCAFPVLISFRVRDCVGLQPLRGPDSALPFDSVERLGRTPSATLSVDKDYFSVPDVDIKKIRSMLTIVDGKIVHESAGIRAG